MRTLTITGITILAGALGFACSDSPSDVGEGAESVQEQSLSDHHHGRDGNPHAGEAFFKHGFPATGGNGRTCATCHVPDEAFQLSPENVEARYQALQRRKRHNPRADDPLFRPIDANDGANDYTNLRQHALIRVVIKLPVDANGQKLMWPVDDPDATEVGVWRSVPSVNNVAFTAPYQLDGRAATLQDQALGALHGHSQITREPKVKFLDDVAAFENTQFSSHGVARLADALAAGRTPQDPDPHLNSLEQAGKAAFQHHCASCHGGPTQNVVDPRLAPAIHDIFVSKPVPPFATDLPFAPSPVEPRLWAFRVPGQDEPTVIPSTDPGEALLTGDVNDLNHFDIPALYGISKTAPYFHDNSAANLTDVVVHYQLLFTALRRTIPDFLPDPIRPDEIPDSEVPALVAYLKKI
jgi:cytochrome c peroxidase